MQDVTAAIIYNNGKILITRRAPGEKHAGWWEFPGGKIEAGETQEMCLRRELMEELAVDTVIFVIFLDASRRIDQTFSSNNIQYPLD